jgi:transposase
MKSYHLGIDLHKSFGYWTLLDSSKKKIFQGKIPTTKNDTLLALHNLPVDTHDIQAGIEPVSQWGWFAEVLESKGVEVTLIDPSKTKLIAASKLKHDKVDSEIIADLLRTDFVAKAYLAPQEVRDLRELVRWRMFFVKMRRGFKNRCHSILWKHGLESPLSDLFGKRGREWIKKQEFHKMYREEIESLLHMIDTLNIQITSLDLLVKEKAGQDERAMLLTTIPGIAEPTALTIVAEVGDFERFKSPEQLASYAGLVSSSRSSGGKLRFGHITKRGSPYLRSIMVEASCQVRPKSGYLYTFYERIKEKKGAKIAHTALARKMLTIMWYLIKKKEPFVAQSLRDSDNMKRGDLVFRVVD